MKKQVYFVALLALVCCISSQPTQAQSEAKIKFEFNDKGSINTWISNQNCSMTFNQNQFSVSGYLMTHEGARTVTFAIENGKPTWTVTKPIKSLEGSPQSSYVTNTYGVEAVWLQQACGKAINQLPSHLYEQIATELELPKREQEQELESLLLSKVVLYDAWTLAALHTASTATESLLSIIEKDSPAYKDFMRMAPKYSNEETRLITSSWHQIDSVIKIIRGQTVAKVIVRESAFWESSGRVRHEAQNQIHTYTLKLIAGEWFVVSDEFKKS